MEEISKAIVKGSLDAIFADKPPVDGATKYQRNKFRTVKAEHTGENRKQRRARAAVERKHKK